MLVRLMDLALRQRVVVVGASLLLVVAGLYPFHELDFEAYPDPVRPLVEVLALPSGLSAEEGQKIVTVPLEVGLAGIRGLDSIRSASIFGLSGLKCYFSWDSDYYAQSQRPLAIVVIGGALAIMVLTRLLLPVLIYLCHRGLRLKGATTPAEPSTGLS